MPGSPNAYDETNPLPPPWYPQRHRRPAPPYRQNGTVSAVLRSAMSRGRRALLFVLVFSLVPVLLTSCNWRGIANVPLPVGRGTGADRMTIHVQMPDTLALNTNSRVRVADVWVGTVRNIALKSDPNLKKWMAILTLDLDPTVKLPVNTAAKIGQTSLLGTQHVELVVPKDRAQRDLKSGDTITLKNSSAYPTVERTLASVAVILNGAASRTLK